MTNQQFQTRENAAWPPADGYTRITGVTWRGLPDGFHTGGAFLSPDQREVWKPLHGLWHYSQQVVMIPTQEAECLEAAAALGLQSFLRNWRIEEAAGKRWLVRPRVTVPAKGSLSVEEAIQVEMDIRQLNQAGWAVNDDITLGKWRGHNFVLDLSAAERISRNSYTDHDNVARWLNGFVDIPWLAYQRKAGKDVLSPFSLRNVEQYGGWDNAEDALGAYTHVYASMYRPIDALWGPREWFYVQGTPEDQEKGRVHTWVLSSGPIPQAKLSRLELTWAWNHWPKPPAPQNT